jgi:hypothetical protein
MHLTGLVGLVGNADTSMTSALNSESLVISRLGVLQCAIPGTEPEERPDLWRPQRLLWKESAAKVTTSGPNSTYTGPMWSHEHLRMLPLGTDYGQGDIPIDILPHEVLLWAKEESELRRLTRISAFVVEDGCITGFDPAGDTERPIHAVLGIRAEYGKQYCESARTIGSGRAPKTASCAADASGSAKLEETDVVVQDWDEKYLVHFDIDGPGGEIITEIHVSNDGKAIRLHTNRDRECYFGELERNDWHVLHPEPGDMLVGMVVCFGTPSGWSRDLNTNEYLKATKATGLVMSTGGS